jgi:hypothetical protein
VEILPECGFQDPVEWRRASDNHYVLGLRLKAQCCFEGPGWFKLLPDTSKMGIDLGIVRFLLGGAAEDDRNVLEEFLMRFDQEIKRGTSKNNYDVWFATAIFVDIPLSKFLLGRWIGEEGCIEVLAV